MIVGRTPHKKEEKLEGLPIKRGLGRDPIKRRDPRVKLVALPFIVEEIGMMPGAAVFKTAESTVEINGGSGGAAVPDWPVGQFSAVTAENFSLVTKDF